MVLITGWANVNIIGFWFSIDVLNRRPQGGGVFKAAIYLIYSRSHIRDRMTKSDNYGLHKITYKTNIEQYITTFSVISGHNYSKDKIGGKYKRRHTPYTK